MARKLKLSFKVNPPVLVSCMAQGLSHAKAMAKANAAAATCRTGKLTPECEEGVADIREYVNRSMTQQVIVVAKPSPGDYVEQALGVHETNVWRERKQQCPRRRAL